MTDREKPDVTTAGLKLWRAAKDFGRALARDTEDVWRGATEPTTKPTSTHYVEVPLRLINQLMQARDDDKVMAYVPAAIARPLDELRAYLDDRG